MYQTSSGPPERVTKRSGQVVPFEADKISRALFAAGESLGRPDAFLARELTDGVVHFLSGEDSGEALTTAHIAELVVKTVRELGQPALAEAFAGFGRRRLRDPLRQPSSGGGEREVTLRFAPAMPAAAELAECVRSYALQRLFARDLVAAGADGLLTLHGLDHPCELEGHVAGSTPLEIGEVVECLVAARHLSGRFVVFDGPEFDLASTGEAGISAFSRGLALGLRATGLSAIVNLNTAEPPHRVGDLAAGPLFGGGDSAESAGRRSALAQRLQCEILTAGKGRARIDWHLSDGDFLPEARSRLESVVQAALDGESVTFVFDRPKRAVALAEGIDRAHPAVLLTVDLNLLRLAAQPGVDGYPVRFLRKLASLARLALSAGVQKRGFLREQVRSHPQASPGEPDVTAGFLLERARLVVVPTGLEEVVESLTGSNPITGGAAGEFAREIVVRIRDVLLQDGRQTLLETSVDGFGSVHPPDHDRSGAAGGKPDAIASFRDALRAATPLHTAAEAGTLTLFTSENRPDVAEAVDWLRQAWQRSGVVRLRFARAARSNST